MAVLGLSCGTDFIHWGHHQVLSVGTGGSVEPPSPSGLLDDFLFGDGRLGDG